MFTNTRAQSVATVQEESQEEDEEEDEEEEEEEEDTKEEIGGRGNSSYEAAWEAQLAKLKMYKRKHGDCNVPTRWAEDPKLANWVSNQRQYKKRLDRGELSHGMTATRVEQLEALGLEWTRHSRISGPSAQSLKASGWEAHLAMLKKYKRKHGDCNVPRAEDPKLGNWVKHQRSTKKRLDRGEPSPMTAERAAKLEALGFTWDARIFSGVPGTNERRRLHARPVTSAGTEIAGHQAPRGHHARADQEAEEGSPPRGHGNSSSPEPIDSASGEEIEIDKIACEACDKESGDDSMLLCDGCDRGYHLHCLRPALEEVPDGEWHCPACLPIVEEHTKFRDGLEDGSDVRAQDHEGQWLAAKVAGVSAGKLRVHFLGWNLRFDEWCAA
jgi:hypothetical protein